MRYPATVAIAFSLSVTLAGAAAAEPIVFHHHLVDVRACDFAANGDLDCTPLPGSFTFDISFDAASLVITEEALWSTVNIAPTSYEVPFVPMESPWNDLAYHRHEVGTGMFFHIAETVPGFPDPADLELGIEDTFLGECESPSPLCRRDYRTWIRVTDSEPTPIPSFGPPPTLQDLASLVPGGEFQFYAAAFIQSEEGRAYLPGSKLYLATVPEPPKTVLFSLALGLTVLASRQIRRRRG